MRLFGKLPRTFFCAVSALALISCAKELACIDTGTNSTDKFFAETPLSSEDSKMFIDAGLTQYWSEGDRIAVYRGGAKERFDFCGYPGDIRGEFIKTDEVYVQKTFGHNYAVYPFSLAGDCLSEGEVAVNIPAVQTYSETAFTCQENVMTAVTESIDDDVLKFRNACSYLMLQIYGGCAVKSIRLSGNDGEKISGQAVVTIPTQGEPTMVMSDDATGAIVLDCGENGALCGTTKEDCTEFWFVVPPVSFSHGFTAEITDIEGNTSQMSTNKEVVLTRNQVKRMSSFKFDPLHAKELLSFSLCSGGNKFRAFKITENAVYIQVPNRTNLVDIVAEFTTTGAKVTVNGEEQTSGVQHHDFSDFGNSLKYVVSAGDGTTREYEIIVCDLPVLYVDTHNGAAVTSKTTYVPCTIRLMEDGSETIIDEYANIKGRGNSTWGFAKKPYNIKFSEKREVLGMPKHKKWCLLANYVDRALLRNAMCHEIAGLADGLSWRVHGKFVDVILNGKLVGNYWLCEKIEVDKNRVNIDKDNGYLLEYDGRNDSYNFQSGLCGLYVNLKAPVEEASEDPDSIYRATIKEFIDNAEAVISGKVEGNYNDYIDANSFVDFMLVDELCGNWDAGMYSTYAYKDIDDILHAGPVWDFDLYTFSVNYNERHNTSGRMYWEYLLKNNHFKYLVKERWAILKQRCQSSYIPDYVNSLYDEIKHSAARDEKIWPVSQKTGLATSNGDNNLSIEAAKDRLLEIYQSQIVWLDTWVNSLQVDFDDHSADSEDYFGQQDKSDEFNFGF